MKPIKPTGLLQAPMKAAKPTLKLAKSAKPRPGLNNAKVEGAQRPDGTFSAQRERDGKVNGPKLGEPVHPQSHAAFEKL